MRNGSNPSVEACQPQGLPLHDKRADPQTEICLPAMGYGEEQIRDLEETIRATPADLVLIATPIDLRALIDIDLPALRVGYELQEIGEPTLEAPPIPPAIARLSEDPSVDQLRLTRLKKRKLKLKVS